MASIVAAPCVEVEGVVFVLGCWRLSVRISVFALFPVVNWCVAEYVEIELLARSNGASPDSWFIAEGVLTAGVVVVGKMACDVCMRYDDR